MNHTLRCRCGTLRGHVDASHAAGRAVCYCKDCQAFARFLGREGEVLDAHGGTEIIACVPRAVHFDAGQDQLACMSLSGKGLLRWYAACCRTAIGNTPRDPKLSYVGLVRDCLPGSDASLAASFGPLKTALNTRSARGKVASTPVAMFFGVLKIMRNVIGSRIGGGYKVNPFFEIGSGRPVRAPQVLSGGSAVR